MISGCGDDITLPKRKYLSDVYDDCGKLTCLQIPQVDNQKCIIMNDNYCNIQNICDYNIKLRVCGGRK